MLPIKSCQIISWLHKAALPINERNIEIIMIQEWWQQVSVLVHDSLVPQEWKYWGIKVPRLRVRKYKSLLKSGWEEGEGASGLSRILANTKLSMTHFVGYLWENWVFMKAFKRFCVLLLKNDKYVRKNVRVLQSGLAGLSLLDLAICFRHWVVF